MCFNKLTGITALLLVGISFSSLAEIYRWVDDQGNVEFSDEPREGAEKIEVRPTATIKLPKLEDLGGFSGPTPVKDASPAAIYSNLKVVFPKNNSAFNSGSGDLTVTMSVQPSLYPNHSLRLTLDGTQIATTKSNFHSFSNLDRGTHQLQLDVIDNSSVVMSGPSVTFTIHRPSVRHRK